MSEFITLLIGLFSDLINFLDSFIIFGNISILRILVILFIFGIGLKFLIHNKRGD